MTVCFLLLCSLTYCSIVIPIGQCENLTDSVPAAITVYRNPEFFKNLTKGEERKPEQKEQEGKVAAVEEEDNGNFHEGISEEDFLDLNDDFQYLGDLKKPKPPSEPDFSKYYGPEYNSDSGESNNYTGESSPVNEGEEDRSENASEGENELSDTSEREIEPPEHRSSASDEIKSDKYHVRFEGDLIPRTEPNLYDESKQYFNPVFVKGMNSFVYPTTYEDLDYYAYSKSFEEKKRKKIQPEVYVDRKKGTREFYKDHDIEEIEEERRSPVSLPRSPRYGGVRADTKHVFRTVSTVDVSAAHPILLVPYIAPKYTTKFRISYQPKVVKLHIIRRV